MKVSLLHPVGCSLLLVTSFGLSAHADRTVLSLDGKWRVADSITAYPVPSEFGHTAPVPGLVNLARPAFPAVDAFYSREQLANRIRSGLSPQGWLTNYWKGKVDQDRNFFWYQKVFRAPVGTKNAILRINKAQFGTAVWLNGKLLGENAACFSASHFDLSPAILWGKDNTLMVRIGAHPAVLPDTFPTGSDFEKIKWTPGIYDSVSVIFCENPIVRQVQVAPKIQSGEIIVQTLLVNLGATPVNTDLSQTVKPWKGAAEAATAPRETILLEPGEERTVTQRIKIPKMRLWSPEDPFLYVLTTESSGDRLTTRFGMREFTFDGKTRRAYLNGKVYYLRGSNITLHRFFEDPLCQDLPWRDEWVRKLLGDLPKKMHWNYFRFCIGPVPDHWLDICDEVGLLIQNEFPVWTGGPGWYTGYARTHDPQEMIRQYKDWVRDNWNHPSVAVWDANNETKDAMFGDTIIPAVRGLDLSNRPWENSYNPPVGPNDPVEDHPYLMQSGANGKLTFNMTQLETMDGKPRPGSLPSDHNAPLINEYGWLWLNRDGTPTRLTENLYPQLMGTTNVTSRERLDLYSYLLAAKTEFWRAHRQYAGIIHFVYLTCSYPGVYTADHFADVTRLKLDPAFADYMGEAFKPLGVYINFFQPTLVPGPHTFTVMLVNDHEKPVDGDLVLTLEDQKGKVLARAQQPFSLRDQGDQALEMQLDVPMAAGKVTLKATAKGKGLAPTVSRRWVKM